uniref:Uncharacterized protein n=1 Tax=Romanomermis culicivorax TaxID=13658 RepID=A0A915IWQ9_ROMCU
MTPTNISIKTYLDKAADASKRCFNQKANKWKINVKELVLLTNISGATAQLMDVQQQQPRTSTAQLDKHGQPIHKPARYEHYIKGKTQQQEEVET